MKILHITPDEKFIDSAIWQFETALPSSNLFYILIDNHNKEEAPVLVKSKTPIVFGKRNKETLKKIVEIYKEYDLICFHSMDWFMSKVVLNISRQTKILWLVFGYEIYNNPKVSNVDEFLLEKTKSYKRIQLKSKVKGLLWHFKFFITNGNGANTISKKALEKADFCGILFKEELNYVKTRINNSPSFFKFCYYPIEFIFKNTFEIKGNNILIGNSASSTNNHLDVFEILKEIDLKDLKLVVPLNYGDKKYAEVIGSKGAEIFPENFKPLLSFLPLQDYNKYLEQCGIVIMGHLRQQAVGNVLAVLWMGAKVYLSNKNTLFNYLKRIGVVLFSIEEDLNNQNSNVLSLLSKNERKLNKDILLKEIGQESLLKELKLQLDTIYNGVKE